MSDERSGGAVDEVDRTKPPRTPWLVAAAFLAVVALHWIAPATLEPALWGVSTWRHVPYSWRVALAVVAASLLFAPAARRLDPLWRARPLPRGRALAALAAAGAAFWLLQTQVYWGNASNLIGAAMNGQVLMKHALNSALSGLLTKVGTPIFGDDFARAAIRIVSVASGLLFLAGSVRLGAALFPGSRVKARVIAASLACAGTTQEFFGIVENYPLAMALQVWAFAGIVRLAQSRPEAAAPIQAIGATSLATATFVATVFLWPATLLAHFRARRRLGRVGAGRAAAWIAAAVVPVALAAAAFVAFGGQVEMQIASFGGFDGSPWVPLSAESATGVVYFTLFSWDHAAARLNAMTLAMPAWSVALAALARRDRGAPPIDAPTREALGLLGVAALGSLAFFFLVHPDLGPTADWMQTATGALAPFVALLAWACARASDAAAARLGTVVVGLSLAHTLPWVLANAWVLR